MYAVMRGGVLALLLLGSTAVAVQARAAEGNAERGERAFQRCFACHSVDPDEKAKLQGPSLYRVVGRPAAAVAGFEYSPALKAKAAAGLVWTEETLDHYIADPEAAVPGTQMSIPGLPEAEERADLIAYLRKSGA
jgi:cytochrome c